MGSSSLADCRNVVKAWHKLELKKSHPRRPQSRNRIMLCRRIRRETVYRAGRRCASLARLGVGLTIADGAVAIGCVATVCPTGVTQVMGPILVGLGLTATAVIGVLGTPSSAQAGQ